eukprot:CAMPEP_0176505752 /NCGR_PEP_ID=MMETSP0200_2-20121128/16671_1 /TAXON_ID=947934 /ORGANISM="Chaetoceros sp., Strain GSL56" /LENGTH=1542 /DNA_ID=CAMNT_0017905345 /DNA_START=27 /DNA_END=4655 /DNA_ORIENTATION=-
MAIWTKPNHNYGHPSHTIERQSQPSLSQQQQPPQQQSSSHLSNGHSHLMTNSHLHISSSSSRGLHAPDSPTVEEGEISSPLMISSSSITKEPLPTTMARHSGNSGTNFRSTSLLSNTNPIGISRGNRLESHDPEEGEIGFAHHAPSTPTTGFMGKRSSWNEGGGGGSSGSYSSSILSPLNVPPAANKGGIGTTSSNPSKVPVGTYASLCDTVDSHPNEMHNVRKDIPPSTGVRNWEPPHPSRKRMFPTRRNFPPYNNDGNNNRMHPSLPGKRHAPGGWWDNSSVSGSSTTTKPSPSKSTTWRDGFREKESHVHRDISSKPWVKPRFEYPPQQQKWSSHTWKRQQSSAGDASTGNGSASVGSGSGNGSYYGPYGTNEDGSTHDNYASLAQPSPSNRDYSKFSPGPRFEPPPGKDHEFSDVDKSLQNSEDKPVLQLARSPTNKGRLDESLTSARSSFHKKSIYSKICEVEEGQIGFNSEKEMGYKNEETRHTSSSQAALVDTNNPLSPNSQSCTDMNIDQALPSSSATNHEPNDIEKLTCGMIGDSNTVLKAVNAIKIMASVIDDNNLVPDRLKSAENVQLPEAELVTKAVQEMQKKVKQGQQQLKLIKFKFKRAISEDAQKKKEQEEKLQEEEKVTDILLAESEELNSKEDNREEIMHERIAIKKRILEGIAESKQCVEEIEKMISDKIKIVEASNAVAMEKETMKKYDTIIGNAQTKSQEARAKVGALSDVLSSLESKLQLAENDLKDAPNKLSEMSRVASSTISDKIDNLPVDKSSCLLNVLDDTLDVSEDIRDLVKTIIHENRQTAIQAQSESVSFVIPEVACSDIGPSSPPVLIPELPIDDEKSFVEYVAYWTKKTQSVTGPGDALYSEPSQAPLYEFTEEQHEISRFAVKEHVRTNKRKLHQRWTELSQEYAIREQLYQKASKRDSNGIHSMGLGVSYSICGQRRGGGADDNNMFLPADDGNSRVTNNPYRRPRRNAGLQVAGGDIVRSDYEQEQIIQQLTAQENMERRIRLGGSDVPRQLCSLEKELRACYKDRMSSRRVDDMLEDQIAYDGINPWSDMEKCIFFDRFLQHPKDFRKIASFLRNKSTHDCIAFYYYSKQSVPFKAALKEHQIRKKKRGDNVSWEATLQAAISLGAIVTAGFDAEKPLMFHLPPNDLTYTTRLLHPLKLELFDSKIHELPHEESSKSVIRKKRSGIATTFYLDPLERKYLCGDALWTCKRSPSSSDLDSLSSVKISRPSSETNIQDIKAAKEEKPESTVRRGVSKWKKKEKSLFFELLEKYGKNWQAIADVIETKTATQARNFYYDNKRQNAKIKRAGKVKVASKELGSEASTQSRSIDLSKLVERQSMKAPQLNYQSGAYPIAFQSEHSKSFSNRVLSVEQTNTGSIQSQQIGRHGMNQQQQLSASLEQQRLHKQHLSGQQRIIELQLAQQHMMEQQRQFQQQQHFLGILNQQQNDIVESAPNWFTTGQLQKSIKPPSSMQNFVDGNEQLNMVLAMRQLHNKQQNKVTSTSPYAGDMNSFPPAPENTESSNHWYKTG